MDTLTAIDALDDAVFNARRVPLTDQVRIDADELSERVAAVRAAAQDDAMTPVLDAIEAIVARARPVPLTDQVRIPADELYARLDELRALVEPPRHTR